MRKCRARSCRRAFSPSISLPLWSFRCSIRTIRTRSVGRGRFPKRANGLIGRDPNRPDVVVAANGGSDLVYVPSGDKALAARIVDILGKQDYVSGIFVDDRIGDLHGTLPLSAIYLEEAPGPRVRRWS
jgi:hypothetical protein